MVHLVTELRRSRRQMRHDRFAWGVATFLACVALLLVVSELMGGF